MNTVGELLREAQQRLTDSEQPQAEAQILLAHVLRKDRSWLFAWGEHTVDPAAAQTYRALVRQRANGRPVAYLTGSRGFWTLELGVDENTLIPRPETEHLVEKTLQLGAAEKALRVLDLGTGSGAIALALAAERPNWLITATDRSQGALHIARRNAQDHSLHNVAFVLANWFAGLAGGFDLIVSNPPYIPEQDPHLMQGDLRHEPRSALGAGADGLDDIRSIVGQARKHLNPGGWLIFEHGFDQGQACRQLLQQSGFVQVFTDCDLARHERLSGGENPS